MFFSNTHTSLVDIKVGHLCQLSQGCDTFFFLLPMPSKKSASDMEENIEKGCNIASLLDLPESTLDFILKLLSPIELCSMSEVCTSLRDRSQSDHLWEEHMKRKWVKVVGDVAYKEWQWHVTAAKEGNFLNQRIDHYGSLGSFTGIWPTLYLGSYLEDCRILEGQRSNKFMMTLYLSLESGRFWFPAQVYKGLMIHHALVSYDTKSNTFQARHQTGGWRNLGTNIEWDMVRVPTVGTPPYALHVSDCLDNLKPGDHIEIQWKGTSTTPTYDWWYAVIGHLESCSENVLYCQCHHSGSLIVEFKQYPQGSYMRRIQLSRKNGEQGDNVGGYYGGIRKLHSEEEIETWQKLFPAHVQRAPILHYMPPVPAQLPIP
ncbi:hypothetical protein RIF29_19731 [Crotalaria pallida]|uniref:F-box domain-containing protein n=1 Tax=Crotalaria pallida TaxID=3830 RepID=A0AAN9I5R2_CROPI